MRRLGFSPLTVMLVLMLTAVAPQQAFQAPAPQSGQAAAAQPTQPAQPVQIPLDLFELPDGLEITL